MLTLKRLILPTALMVLALSATAQDYSNIQFIENKGQWDSRVKFKGEVDNGAVFVRSTGFTILQHDKQDYEALKKLMHDPASMAGKLLKNASGELVLKSHAWNVDFVDASPNMQILADKPSDGYNNYFIGNDPSKWASGCRIYQAITLKEVYPNVDVRYYTYNGAMKYDIIARPGADIGKIALKYEGADKLQVKDKQLLIRTSLGEMRESYPLSYQAGLKGRKEVKCRYLVKGNTVKFDVEDYDPSATLVIDPTLVFASLSGSSANNWGFTATYGPDGTMYGGGIIIGGGGEFPTKPGAFQTSYQNGQGDLPTDIGIIKLSANGGTMIYGTYIGGRGNDQPHSLIVDPQGELIVAGRSSSDNYPITGPQLGNGGLLNDYDIVLTKLNASGTALIGSRKIGGTGADGVNIKSGRGGASKLEQNYGDDGRSEVIIDAANNIYLASCTQSSVFPVTAGAFQQTYGGGGQDGVVLKFNADLSTQLFTSFIGGDQDDAAYVLALSPGGDIYVAGGTESTNLLPGTQTGVLSATNNGGIDGFVARISSNGSTVISSTYVGTDKTDQVYGIQFDRSGFPYIMGQTLGKWTVFNAIYSNANAKQFIAKLKPDLSGYVYSTIFGKDAALPSISPVAFLVDRCENVYVSGWGGDAGEGKYPNSGTINLPTTTDKLPYPKGGPDGSDFYFFVLERDATRQLFGSYFGQTGGYPDHVDGGTSRFDANGVIYQAMCANCGGQVDPAVSPGVYGPVNRASPGCNLGMVKIRFNLAGVGSDVQSAIGGVPSDTSGCFPLLVTFTDQIRNATEYVWNFGDNGGPVAVTDPAYASLNEGPFPAGSGYTRDHTFNTVGEYTVMLIATNPTSCNLRDTSYIHIRVGDLKANLFVNVAKLDPCYAFNYQFSNNSVTDPRKPYTDTSFAWNFGDGSPRVRAGLGPVTHAYAGPGTYNAWLVLNDSAYCNNPDSLQIVVRVAANVDAQFNTPPVGCAPYTAVFENVSIGGLNFEWNFGDPASGADNTSIADNPTHVYNTPGTYTIVMVANDPNTCNKTDTTRTSIVVYDKPEANYSYTPATAEVNTPDIFTNLSSVNSVRFKWEFGDGDTLATTSRAPITHQYNNTGTFNACLIAFNAAGCTDTFCLPVSALVDPLVDVPNAFTPNSKDVNSIVRVAGFGISKMHFTIWNRWGQKVFETANRSEGWNGKVNGVLQPMDVYAYTLDVEFFDGKKATRKGDITLIR